MQLNVRAKRKDTGAAIEGNYCRYYFIHSEADLTEAELETAIPLPAAETDINGNEVINELSTEYVVIREAVQTMATQTIKIPNLEGEYVEITAELPLFTEIEAGSALSASGMLDKNGVEIFEGDTVKYHAGINDFERYEVIYNSGKFKTNPNWPWGCNFGCFESTKIEVI